MPDPVKIAIVDDHLLFRQGLTHLINLLPGYHVCMDADNGKDLLHRLPVMSSLPDIVLLDINMPEMNGYDTALWLKQNHPSIKVLALSMLDSDTSIIKMIRNGARGYILKDADTAELKLAFSELMGKGYFYNDMVSRRILQSVNQLVNDDIDPAFLVKITDRELQFLQLACTEKPYKEIAAEMFVSERTVDGYRDALFKKLSINTRVGLAMYAVKHGFVKL
jgi:DNA-binding NarL/FixJ family response regulator